MESNLDERKNALVVGGMHGVGKGIAKALSKRGFNVIVADKEAPIGSYSSSLIPVDITKVESIEQFCSYIIDETKQLDILIITVGVIDECDILNVQPDKWQWILNTNLLGSVLLVDSLLPLLKNSPNSKIMLTGSGSGFGKIKPGSNLGLYAITKHAHLGYFRVLYDRLAEDNIQVSLLVPSAVKGELAENSAKNRTATLGEEFLDSKGKQPKGRLLADPYILGEQFVSDFLKGKKIIANAPKQLIEICESELNELKEILNY